MCKKSIRKREIRRRFACRINLVAEDTYQVSVCYYSSLDPRLCRTLADGYLCVLRTHCFNIVHLYFFTAGSFMNMQKIKIFQLLFSADAPRVFVRSCVLPTMRCCVTPFVRNTVFVRVLNNCGVGRRACSVLSRCFCMQ